MSIDISNQVTRVSNQVTLLAPSFSFHCIDKVFSERTYRPIHILKALGVAVFSLTPVNMGLCNPDLL